MHWQHKQDATQAAAEHMIAFGLTVLHWGQHPFPVLLSTLAPFLRLWPRANVVTAVPGHASAQQGSVTWLQAQPALWGNERYAQAAPAPSKTAAASSRTTSYGTGSSTHLGRSDAVDAAQESAKGNTAIGTHLHAGSAERTSILPASLTSILHPAAAQHASGRRMLRHLATGRAPAWLPGTVTMASLIRPATRVHNSRPFLLAEQLLGRSQASEPQMRRSSPQHAVNAADTLSLPATRGSVAVYTVASDTTWVDRVSMKQSAQEDARTQIDRLFDLPDARMPNKDLPRVPLEHFPLVDNPAAYLLANSSLAPSFHFMPMTLLQETVVQTVRKQVVVELERQRVALSKQGASTTQSGQQAAQGLVQSAVNGIIDDKVVHLLLNKLQAAMQEERFRQGWIH